MNDLEDDPLERMLRQVQPSGPPPGLRERIVTARRSAPRVWPWAAAAAALLAFTLLLQGIDQGLSRPFTPESAPWEAEARVLGDLLGGDAEAQSAAEQIVTFNRLRAQAPAPPESQ